MAEPEIQFVGPPGGEPTAVIIPLELWREIESERETAYLLKSDTMRSRLREALSRDEGIPLDTALEKLGA
jgi:hypothetical protein